MTNVQKICLTFFLALVFVIEVLYFYPAPNGDDVFGLMFSINLCTSGSWVLPYDTPPGAADIDNIIHTRFMMDRIWDNHGWVPSYVMSKFNIFCNIRGIFLFNFIIKILTALTAFKILNFNGLNNNRIFIYLSIFFIFLVQLKIQFRFETYAILIYLLIILCIKKEKYIFTGSLFALLFYSHIMFFSFIGLFTLIFYFKKIYKNFLYLLLGFIAILSLLTFIYEYSLLTYIEGMWWGRRSWTDGNVSPSWLSDFLEFYIYTKFLPIWSILFFIFFFFIISGNRMILLTLPFIYYFGPRLPVSNYYLIGLIPLMIILFNETINKKEIPLYKRTQKYLFYLMSLIMVLGYLQYFSRNLLTIYNYGNEINYSKDYINKNLHKSFRIPNFSFLFNNDYKYSNEEILKRTKNKKYLLNKDVIYNIYEAGNRNHPCPNRDILNKEHSLKIFGKKIYNSNAGYGIYVCKYENPYINSNK